MSQRNGNGPHKTPTKQQLIQKTKETDEVKDDKY